MSYNLCMKIALYVNSLDDEYQLSLFKSIQKRTRDRGIELLCIQQEHMNPPNTGDFLFPSRTLLNVDGILLLTSSMLEIVTPEVSTHIAEQFKETPTVSIGSSIPNIPSIIIRGKSSMEQLMEHLIYHHNYRHFLFLSGPKDHQDNIVRLAVFKKALENAQQKFPTISYDIIYGFYNENKATHAMNQYWENNRDNPLDVVVAANDEMAIGALKVLRTRSDYRWQQTAVTGFDDTDRAQMSQPPLTTIRQPYDKAATQAVEALYTLIMKQQTDTVIKVNSTLQIRNSCGCTDSTDSGITPDRDKELIRAKTTLNSIQNQTVKATRYMRNASILTQTLNTANSLGELGPAIYEFLDNLDIRDFYMVLFPEPSHELPDKGLVVYKKASGADGIEQDLLSHPEEVSLHHFFTDIFSEGEENAVTRCIHYLRAGQDMYGLIVYDADDLAHPHICNTAAFLASTLQRFRITELEKARSDWLEMEVDKRTTDLRKTHELLEKESQRRIQVEAEVLKISELERMRFSMDLHDDICQRLAGLSMKCRGIAANGSKEKIEELSEQIDETLSRTRQYAHDSYPVELNTLGLNQAMDNLCHLYQKQTDYKLIYTWHAPDPLDISQNAQIALFRILQEALHNIVKHAKATEVRVSISTKGWNGETLVVKIEDNGQGLKASRSKKRKESSGLGLRSMQYRADQIGAEFSISSPETGGTKIELTLPLKKN